MFATDHRDIKSIDVYGKPMRLSFCKLNSSYLRQDVDPARRDTELNNRSGCYQILLLEFGKWCPELLERLPNLVGVPAGALYPEIDVAGRSWQSMGGDSVGSDEHELNFFFGERGQYVVEI